MHFPSLGHLDHGLTPEHLNFIQTYEGFDALAPGSFICETLELPDGLSALRCALHGPSVDDPPVREDEVFYAERGARGLLSRLVRRPCRPTQRVAVIGILGETLYTAYGTRADKPSPREVHDPNHTPESRQHAETFWSMHALSALQAVDGGVSHESA